MRPPIRVLAACAAAMAAAQAAPLTLREAVETALARYPAVREAAAGVDGAAASLRLARTAYLPSLAAVAGVNRATRNNTLGLLLPSQVLAPISGPVLGTNSGASAWGSTVGVLVSWEPYDFGQRRANVAVAEAGRVRAAAGVARTRLEVAALVADAVLTLAAAGQTIQAAEAAVARAAELHRVTEGLVRAELRPGAELSLAKAEQAAAEAQLVRARQAAAEARAQLAGYLDRDPQGIEIEVGRLLEPATAEVAAGAPAEAPAAREQEAAAGEARARVAALERRYRPRIELQGTAYARGTGAMADGRLLGGANGLAPNIQNWAVGATASFDLFALPALRAERAAGTARLQAEQARYDQTLLALRTRRAQAEAAWDGAVALLRTTPVALAAARTGVEQARARYGAGLGTALEMADAHRRLAQAEIDDRLARLATWRAKLAIEAAAGDLSPLLAEASR